MRSVVEIEADIDRAFLDLYQTTRPDTDPGFIVVWVPRDDFKLAESYFNARRQMNEDCAVPYQLVAWATNSAPWGIPIYPHDGDRYEAHFRGDGVPR